MTRRIDKRKRFSLEKRGGKGDKYAPLICMVVSRSPRRRCQKRSTISLAENRTRLIRSEHKAVAYFGPHWVATTSTILCSNLIFTILPRKSGATAQSRGKWPYLSNVAWTVQQRAVKPICLHIMMPAHPLLETDRLKKQSDCRQINDMPPDSAIQISQYFFQNDF